MVLSVRRIKKITRDFLVSAIKMDRSKIYMNKNLIENIVSDCGYEALGLYEYLYCNRDKKYNVTVISMYQIAGAGSYHNEDTLVESIEDLKEFGYLEVVGNIYLFPKSTENYDAVFEMLKSIENIENPDELSRLKEEDMQLILKVYKSKKEDIEMGYIT